MNASIGEIQHFGQLHRPGFITNIAGGHMQKSEVRKAFESWVPLGRAAEAE